MKICFESELMKNQKHAVVMPPDKTFEVLQSDEGNSLFFSIGDDGVFYLTREVSQSSSGWTRIDLSSVLKNNHGGVGAAGTFDVSQNAQTGKIDLALAFTVKDADFLYLSQGHSNADFAWANGVQWTSVAGLTVPRPRCRLRPSPTSTSCRIPDSGNGVAESIVVDLKKPDDPLEFYHRYYVTPSAPQKWNDHPLAADLAVEQSCLGKSASGVVRPGIFTLGTDKSGPVLIYSPLHGFREQPPTQARLTVPSGASAIATALNAAGDSNLFVAADKAIYLFTPDNLSDHVTGLGVVQNDMLTGAQSLHAETSAAMTAVWGVNDKGDLFRLQCKAGSEGNQGAWSYPVPIVRNVKQIASFLNRRSEDVVGAGQAARHYGSVIFALLLDGTLSSAHSGSCPRSGGNAASCCPPPTSTIWSSTTVSPPTSRSPTTPTSASPTPKPQLAPPPRLAFT